MANIEFACTNCGEPHTKDELTSKKVHFGSVGFGSQVFRTRTVDWLCERCLGKDPAYNFPKDISQNERMELARARRKAKEVGDVDRQEA